MRTAIPAALRTAGLVLSLLSLYVVGLGIRRYVLAAQYRMIGSSPPFTLESALYFRRVEQVLLEGRIPAHDPELQYPEGVAPAENDTVGSEYVYAALTRLFPPSLSLTEKLRWIEAAWFCLGIPLMALWIRWQSGSWAAGHLAAALYAVAISSVLRSTGQELLHENFALPLLLAHLSFDALFARAPNQPIRWLALALSALFLVLALMSWDLIQLYVLLWMLVHTFRVLGGREAVRERGTVARWGVPFAFLFTAGLWNPYLRAHGFLLSLPMLLGYGILLATLAQTLRHPSPTPAWCTAFLLILPALIGWPCGGTFRSSYEHFLDLGVAKLMFFNRKPEDPALLNFNARILWVPGLNSASWPLAGALFPLMLPLTALSGMIWCMQKSGRRDRDLAQILFFSLAFFAAFVFFVRFHVYATVFAAAGLGLTAAAMRGSARGLRRLVWGVLLAGVGVEAAHTLDAPEQWGRGQVYYRELEALTQWLVREVSPQPVLANFGVSASILAYGKCPVLLHPKFEARELRERVREYGEKLFLGTERELRDWADRLGARWLVYALGEFSPVEPGRQMRYFVNALNPPDHAAARQLEWHPETCRWFRRVWGNRKYRVFRILTRADEERAQRYGEEARAALESGDLDRAEECATSALLLDAEEETAQEVWKHVGALRQQGFKAGTEKIP